MTRTPRDTLSECLSQIFRSEDLETSISLIYDYFKKYIPLDFITIVVYDATQHAVQHRIHSTDAGIILVEELIKFSEDTKKEAQDLFHGNTNIRYIPNGKKIPSSSNSIHSWA